MFTLPLTPGYRTSWWCFCKLEWQFTIRLIYNSLVLSHSIHRNAIKLLNSYRYLGGKKLDCSQALLNTEMSLAWLRTSEYSATDIWKELWTHPWLFTAHWCWLWFRNYLHVALIKSREDAVVGYVAHWELATEKHE